MATRSPHKRPLTKTEKEMAKYYAPGGSVLSGAGKAIQALLPRGIKAKVQAKWDVKDLLLREAKEKLKRAGEAAARVAKKSATKAIDPRVRGHGLKTTEASRLALEKKGKKK